MTTDAKPMTTLPGEIAEALGRYRGSVAGAALYECATNAAVERDDRDALVAAILAYGASALARAEAAERERDEARAERDDLRERVRALAEEWEAEAARRKAASDAEGPRERDRLRLGAAFEIAHAERLRALLSPPTIHGCEPEVDDLDYGAEGDKEPRDA